MARIRKYGKYVLVLLVLFCEAPPLPPALDFTVVAVSLIGRDQITLPPMRIDPNTIGIIRP